MSREFSKKFYDSKQWENVRTYCLMRDKYKCVRCGGVKNLEVHHKVWLTPENINDADVTLNEKNLETLCRNCHKEEHRPKGQTFDENGFLIDSPG